jgi:APA family basic amino acid/polyamine antiporter
MGRRHDLPAKLAYVSAAGSPTIAVIATGLAIALLALVGDVRFTWSLSACAVLIYYAITNIAALRLPREARRYHPAIAWAGLVSCVALALLVDWRAIAATAGLLAIGFIIRTMVRIAHERE